MKPAERAYALAKRFKTELGYWSAEPWAIHRRKDGGRVMYYLIHATDHPKAPGLMRRAYENSARPAPTLEQAKLEISDLLS